MFIVYGLQNERKFRRRYRSNGRRESRVCRCARNGVHYMRRGDRPDRRPVLPRARAGHTARGGRRSNGRPSDQNETFGHVEYVSRRCCETFRCGCLITRLHVVAAFTVRPHFLGLRSCVSPSSAVRHGVVVCQRSRGRRSVSRRNIVSGKRQAGGRPADHDDPSYGFRATSVCRRRPERENASSVFDSRASCRPSAGRRTGSRWPTRTGATAIPGRISTGRWRRSTTISGNSRSRWNASWKWTSKCWRRATRSSSRRTTSCSSTSTRSGYVIGRGGHPSSRERPLPYHPIADGFRYVNRKRVLL